MEDKPDIPVVRKKFERSVIFTQKFRHITYPIQAFPNQSTNDSLATSEEVSKVFTENTKKKGKRSLSISTSTDGRPFESCFNHLQFMKRNENQAKKGKIKPFKCPIEKINIPPDVSKLNHPQIGPRLKKNSKVIEKNIESKLLIDEPRKSRKNNVGIFKSVGLPKIASDDSTPHLYVTYKDRVQGMLLQNY